MDLGHLLPPRLAMRMAAALHAVERRLHELTGATDGLARASSRHLLAAGGKRFRPLVALLAAEATNHRASSRPVRDVAVAVELLHLSTLYHDDVIDGADTRRGVASANRRFGDRVAVAAGDRLTALALEAATEVGDEVPALLARTYGRLVAGEHLETRLVGRLDGGRTAYLEVVDGKTASLVATAARAGAVAAGADAPTRDAIEAWGRTVGVAFQVADDLLDLTATAAEAGKPVTHDIADGVYTWPVLDALTTAAGDPLRCLLRGPLPHPPDVVARALEHLHACGAFERTMQFVRRLLAAADHHLDALPSSHAATALRDLGHSLVPVASEPAVDLVAFEAEAVGA